MVEPCIRQTEKIKLKKDQHWPLKSTAFRVLSVHLLILLEHRFCLGTLLVQNGQKQGYTIRELLVSYMAT